LITGASGAIGGAIADALAAEKAHLFLTGRHEERLAAAAARARLAGAERVEAFAADLTQDAELSLLVDRVLDAFSGVDLLIHSQGLFLGGAMAEASIEHLDRQYRTNLRSPYLLTQQLLPSLKERQAQVVFINSSSGYAEARPSYGAYSATKHALRAVADSLRGEVNPHGVRVLTVFPGRTASPMQQEVHRYEGREYDPDRWIKPEDVAGSVVHALSLPYTAELTDLHLRPMLP
jgi:NAD(P)-dependent dehydrogenase (short-subunit alcohol dehydrogenase family)